MNFTKREKYLLLKGEADAANSLCKMLKTAFEQKLVEQETVQTQCLQMIESWVALREQRIKAETSDDPAHIFH